MQNLSYLLGDNISVDQKEDLETRLDIISHKLKYVTDKPILAIINQLEPLALASVNADLIDFVGAKLIENSGEISWNDLKIQDPEIVVIAVHDQTIQQLLSNAFQLVQNPVFNDLFAVKSNRVYLVDSSKFYGIEGAELVDHLELMAEIINPKQFHFGFEGSDWVKFNI